jgi:hypothetical protein
MTIVPRKCLALGLLLAALAGCGGPTAPSASQDGRKVARVITAAADRAGVAVALGEFFAPGSTPSKTELKNYSRYDFEPVGEPAFTADGCTIKVKVTENKSQQSRELDWTLVKAGENWQLKSAPLQ